MQTSKSVVMVGRQNSEYDHSKVGINVSQA